MEEEEEEEEEERRALKRLIKTDEELIHDILRMKPLLDADEPLYRGGKK